MPFTLAILKIAPMLALLAILLSSIVIDILTLFIVFIGRTYMKLAGIKRKQPHLDQKEKRVSIIIPAYNEENNIYQAIYNAFNQTLPPKQVIVINDNSTDKTLRECLRAQAKFKNLRIISQRENKGKAFNVSEVLKKIPLEKITIVLDADTFLTKRYIEKIVKPFANKRVVIATGTSLPIKHGGLLGRLIFHGSIFNYKFFCFRKRAQSYRNAVSVVTGDSGAYRTSFLKGVGGLPLGTQTEDMDVTWMALEQGYCVIYQQDAIARSKDAATLKGHWKQLTRWYAGGVQCLLKHNIKLFQAKSLLFTTLIPSYVDSFLYSVSLLFFGGFFFFYPAISLAFFTADLLFTVIAILYLGWRGLIFLPHVYVIKFIWSLAWLYATFKTLFQYIFGKHYWGGTWKRDSFYKENANP